MSHKRVQILFFIVAAAGLVAACEANEVSDQEVVKASASETISAAAQGQRECPCGGDCACEDEGDKGCQCGDKGGKGCQCAHKDDQGCQCGHKDGKCGAADWEQ